MSTNNQVPLFPKGKTLGISALLAIAILGLYFGVAAAFPPVGAILTLIFIIAGWKFIPALASYYAIFAFLRGSFNPITALFMFLVRVIVSYFVGLVMVPIKLAQRFTPNVQDAIAQRKASSVNIAPIIVD
jgi:membrane-bound ClpP family serine protease